MKSKNVPRLMFRLSLLLYPITVIIAIILGCFVGIDHGWAMPAWSDGSKMYGFDAVCSYLVLFIMVGWPLYIINMLYELGYIVYKIIRYIKRKGNKHI